MAIRKAIPTKDVNDEVSAEVKVEVVKVVTKLFRLLSLLANNS